MAMGMNGSRGRGGRRQLVSEINVTPLVDVMLVLLIIFMVTAPMMTHGLDVDLPETTAKALPQKEMPIMITIDKGRQISINKVTGDISLLRQQLQSLATQTEGVSQPVFLKADKLVPYGLVAEVMAEIKEAGFDKLGMVTQPKDTD